MKTKICSKCKIEKSLDEFYNDKTHSDGFSSACKICIKNRIKKYYKNNKLKIKKYLLKNKETILIKRKKYNLEHKEEIKIYNLNRKDKYKKWCQENKEHIKNYRREYYLKNKLKIDKYARKYYNEKRNNNLNYKLKCNLRHRLGMAVKYNYKSESTINLLGCSIEFLKQHLQSQFKIGMSWDNYGKWHIDHIKPCASFDLSKPEEQQKCFHYKNLQPLWAKENLIKGKKFNKEMKERIL